MKFKNTLVLTLAFSVVAFSGIAREAPRPTEFKLVQASKGSDFFHAFRSAFDRDGNGKPGLFFKGSYEDERPQKVRPSLMQRVRLYFKSNSGNAATKPLRVERRKKAKIAKRVEKRVDRPGERARSSYVFSAGFRKLRAALVASQERTIKSSRRTARREDRRSRVIKPNETRQSADRRLTWQEENQLARRLAHGDVNGYRQVDLVNRSGPDRGGAGSWISRVFSNTRINRPVTSDRKYGMLVARYARAYGVPVELAHAVIKVESNYRANARGRAGEIGLMQIKPATARLMGYSGSSKGLYVPEQNIKYGMKYLGQAYKLGGGTTCGTILKYNAGHGARRMNRISARYCAKVKRHMRGA